MLLYVAEVGYTGGESEDEATATLWKYEHRKNAFGREGKHLQPGFQKRLFDERSRGSELISEWDGTATKGSYNLVRKVTRRVVRLKSVVHWKLLELLGMMGLGSN